MVWAISVHFDHRLAKKLLGPYKVRDANVFFYQRPQYKSYVQNQVQLLVVVELLTEPRRLTNANVIYHSNICIKTLNIQY